MAYTAITTSQIDNGSPMTQPLGQQIADNFADHESRILSLQAFGDNSVIDDFMKTAVEARIWDSFAGGGGSPTITLTAEHVLALAAIGSAVGIRAVIAVNTANKMRIKMTEEYVAVFEARVKRNATDPDVDTFNAILQDETHAISADTIFTDLSDYAGFVRDASNANRWRFKTASGGAGGADVGNLGTGNAWTKLNMIVTCSATAGSRKIEAYVNGAAISGSPFTTNIPTGVFLRPALGCRNDSGLTYTQQLQVDRVAWYVSGIPVAA